MAPGAEAEKGILDPVAIDRHRPLLDEPAALTARSDHVDLLENVEQLVRKFARVLLKIGNNIVRV